MADVFISYSKADRDIIVRLAAMLETEGWSVWWDKNLAAGDAYRDDIMRELAAARAVVSVWTANSIRSDWVRAEAGRAKADGKLIPVKSRDLAYGDIPLPFGEMHTENLGQDALICAAIVAQLAKPQFQASAVEVARAAARYEVLAWVGVIGGAITLFTNLRGIIDLADWVRFLVAHWLAWTHALWQWPLAFIGISLTKAWVPVLNFLVFASMMVVGSLFAMKTMNNRLPVGMPKESGSLPGQYALLLSLSAAGECFVLWDYLEAFHGREH